MQQFTLRWLPETLKRESEGNEIARQSVESSLRLPNDLGDFVCVFLGGRLSNLLQSPDETQGGRRGKLKSSSPANRKPCMIIPRHRVTLHGDPAIMSFAHRRMRRIPRFDSDYLPAQN
jgi:hypothetical protein